MDFKYLIPSKRSKPLKDSTVQLLSEQIYEKGVHTADETSKDRRVSLTQVIRIVVGVGGGFLCELAETWLQHQQREKTAPPVQTQYVKVTANRWTETTNLISKSHTDVHSRHLEPIACVSTQQDAADLKDSPVSWC